MRRQKITQHIRGQNWFSALTDFALIVLAVFIALQLSNWMSSRQMSAEGDVFTERLTADLRQEAWIYDYVTAYHEDVLANAEAAEKHLDGSAVLSDEKFLIAAYRASQYTWWNPRRTAFDELVGTGKLDLIKDDELRRSALAVYASPLLPALAQTGRGAPYRQIFRQAVSTPVQRALGKDCGDSAAKMGDYGALISLLNYDCTLDLPAKDIQTAVQALQNVPEIGSNLRLRIATLETELADLKERNTVTLFFENLKSASAP